VGLGECLGWSWAAGGEASLVRASSACCEQKRKGRIKKSQIERQPREKIRFAQSLREERKSQALLPLNALSIFFSPLLLRNFFAAQTINKAAILLFSRFVRVLFICRSSRRNNEGRE